MRICLLVCGALASLAFATAAAAADEDLQLTEAEGKLLAIDQTIPYCIEKFPKAGHQLDLARKQWAAAHAKEEAAFQAKLAANAEVAKLVQEKLRPVDRKMVDELGAAACDNFTKELQRSGPLGAMDYYTAIGSYYQNVAGARVVADACIARHANLAEEIASNRQKWKDADGKVQAEAITTFEAGLKEPNSPLKGVIAEVERAYLSMFEEAEKRGNGESACHDFFDRLGNGSLRERTPQVFEAIERGPETK